ncbi:hypothetical protein ACFFGH_29070 [Lysobacter korlensis]|uniref:Integral membrane protein n=1 Tax=Lysobacter korlensis TaxID=553636 RepID=A0ABV6RY47_9GAMM
MIEWLTWVLVAVATAAGLLCLVFGIAGRPPADLTLGSVLLVELLLLVQLGVAVTAPLVGNEPTGNLVEYYVYLVSAILIPPLTVLWGLVERSRWSTVVLAIGALAVAVMVYRMHVIWFVQMA